MAHARDRYTPVSSSEARLSTRRWREAWTSASVVLEQDRWDRLAKLSLDQRNRMVLDLLSLWRPGLRGDDGEGLLRLKRALGGQRPGE